MQTGGLKALHLFSSALRSLTDMAQSVRLVDVDSP
jgi:hypothetical protein